MNNTPEFDKLLENLKPDIERLSRKVDASPASAITGFIFSMNPRGFIKFGNIQNKGDELIRLHMVLASLAAEMEESGKNYGDVPFVDIDAGQQPLGQAPEEIADELARSVLISGLEPGYADKAMILAQRYIQSRRTTPPEEKK